MEGRITAITRQKHDNARASIFMDGAFAFGLNEQTIEQFRLRKGDHLDEARYAEIIEFDHFIDAKRLALSFINYRARSEKEIRDRLKCEELEEAVIERVLGFLAEYGLVNDGAWARAFVNDKLMRKPVSARQLAFGLGQKGVPKTVIAETLAELDAKQSDQERATLAAEKRWPRIVRTEADPKKRKQKLYTFLAQRGFSFETISGVYAALSPNDRTTDADDPAMDGPSYDEMAGQDRPERDLDRDPEGGDAD